MGLQNESEKFVGKADFEKSLNSLLGIVEGITIDGSINEQEIQFLENWINNNRVRADQHPFNELITAIEAAIADNVLSAEELQDIKWLCNRLTSHEYFNEVTADMQKLHAVLAGIAADGRITENELNGLSGWLNEHEHLKKCWPYDEVESLIASVMADKKIDADEQKTLMNFFGEFVSMYDNKTIVNPGIKEKSNIMGLCAIKPDINFNGLFCLTGTSAKYSRSDFKKVIAELGGATTDSVTKNVNYLVVGAEGNPNWAFACYGRKVETAVTLRKNGHQIMIIHENDLHKSISVR
jgi:NAD-dependent DNA ligase